MNNSSKEHFIPDAIGGRKVIRWFSGNPFVPEIEETVAPSAATAFVPPENRHAGFGERGLETLLWGAGPRSVAKASELPLDPLTSTRQFPPLRAPFLYTLNVDQGFVRRCARDA